MIDIISKLEQFATANNMHFIYGSNEYASADRYGYKNGEDVLVVDYEAYFSFNTGNNVLDPEREEFSVTMMFGKKFDDNGTSASLDETMLQKHKRRLSDMANDSYNKIISFACQNDFLIRDIRMTISANMFSDNLDFINCVVNFEY